MRNFTKKDWIPDTATLPRQAGIVWFSFAVAFLAFVASIALGALMSIERDSTLWDARVFGRLTVQIMPEGIAPPAAEIPAAIEVLKQTPDVVSADVMAKSENLALIRPWLGQNAALDALPFPVLIDVKLAPGAAPDIADLQKRLLVSAPHAVIDDHRQWIHEIGSAPPNQSPWLAALLLCVSCCSFLFLFLSSTRAQISLQWSNLELLRLLGATDWRVAQLCGTWPETAVLLASAGGTLLGVVLFLLRGISDRFGIHMPLVAALPSAELPWLAFIPLTAAILAWVTGRLLVMSALRRA